MGVLPRRKKLSALGQFSVQRVLFDGAQRGWTVCDSKLEDETFLRPLGLFKHPLVGGARNEQNKLKKGSIMAIKTVVIGASPNPDRYSYKAVQSLVNHKRPVVAVGLRKGEIAGVDIQTGHPQIDGVHTISLYVGPAHQPDLYDYMLSLKPKRFIFNPGTENPELAKLLRENDVEVTEACTLVLLATNQFETVA